ncbi:MAG: glycoside hydrolase family protein [Symploca sp. SIO1A3]|nr:glycoside hydrolase family protein [Symploca sp. SIO1A3]
MKVNQAGINLIKDCEGLHEKCGKRDGKQLLKPYYCPSGVLTVGYGTTGPRVKAELVITEATAEDWLREDLSYFEDRVKKLVKIELNENEFSALVSFTYNCGEGALGGSTALKRLNAGDKEGCVEALQWWNKGASGVLPGLVRRRQLEGELFLAPVSMKRKIEILCPTPLKPSTQQSKEIIATGGILSDLIPGVYLVQSVQQTEDHYHVTFEDGKCGYIYKGHCEILNSHQPTANVNLKVPFFSQLDNKYQPYVTCNVTSVAMCCAFFGEKPSNFNVQMEDEFYLWLQGKGLNRTYHSNLVKVFEACGYKDTFKTDATWEEVKEHVRKGNPVIYSGTLTHGGHIIVIRGFNESKKCWYVNDPYGEYFSWGYNTKLTGENLEYSYGLLSRKSMTGLPTTTWAHFPSRKERS